MLIGGVGITPLMSSSGTSPTGRPGDIYLLIATRTERDIIFRDEIEQLRRRFPNLHVCITLSRRTRRRVDRTRAA